METKLIITVALTQGLLDYLVTRPYAEVYQLIAPLLTLEKLDPPKAPVPTPAPVVD